VDRFSLRHCSGPNRGPIFAPWTYAGKVSTLHAANQRCLWFRTASVDGRQSAAKLLTKGAEHQGNHTRQFRNNC
jgi:hypothetical protein